MGIFGHREEDPPLPGSVDELLARALDPNVEFTAREWADETPANDSVSDSVSESVDYSRVRCTKCGDEKDAWFDNNGALENPADGWHSHPGEGPMGTDKAYPTERVPDAKLA